MKICIAQTKSVKGDIQSNIQNHLSFVHKAVDLGADLIIFPELSLTGYEPEIAENLATNKDDPIFDIFQQIANQHQLAISIGVPTREAHGICISMIIFQAKQDRTCYSKQLLHSDEFPYFVAGNTQTYIHIKKTKIAFGICYETMQRNHIINAIKEGAQIYVASVAKHQDGIDRAIIHFQQSSKEFNTPIFMVNSVGKSDNFMSAGRSAIWNKNGELITSLNQKQQELLYFEMNTEKFEKHHISNPPN